MLDTFLIPQNTVISEKGDGPATDISAATHRVFLITLKITQIVEQESIDVSIFGSGDGNAWGQKALIGFPQKFYRGETPMLLDLRQQPEIKMLRAHWEVNRWGRGPDKPMFEVQAQIKEVPAEMLQQAGAEAKARA
jgi:hypothetical protein